MKAAKIDQDKNRSSFDLSKLVRSNVKGLKPYSSARDEYVSDGTQMVFLDANENPFENGVNRYPDPQQRNLKTVLGKLKGVAVENILLGNGSDEVLDLLFRAFCEPNVDNIITLPPTYGMYQVLCGINAVANREVLLDGGFQPRVTEILQAADSRSKLLFICSPNNPTGNGIDPSKIEALLKDFPGLVVIDEAYIDFADQPSWTNKLFEYPNLVVTQTLSKAYGMAGIRLGICYASAEIISVLNKIKPPYNVNELTQKRALKALENPQVIKEQITEILTEREKLHNILRKIPFISKIYASEANFILVKVDDATKRYAQILEKGIVVRNRSTQPLCSNTLRFTIGRPVENEKLVNVLYKLK